MFLEGRCVSNGFYSRKDASCEEEYLENARQETIIANDHRVVGRDTSMMRCYLFAGSFRLSAYELQDGWLCLLGEVVLREKRDAFRMRAELRVNGQSRATWFGVTSPSPAVIIPMRFCLPLEEAREAVVIFWEIEDKDHAEHVPYFERIEIGKEIVEKLRISFEGIYIPNT